MNVENELPVERPETAGERRSGGGAGGWICESESVLNYRIFSLYYYYSAN